MTRAGVRILDNGEQFPDLSMDTVKHGRLTFQLGGGIGGMSELISALSHFSVLGQETIRCAFGSELWFQFSLDDAAQIASGVLATLEAQKLTRSEPTPDYDDQDTRTGLPAPKRDGVSRTSRLTPSVFTRVAVTWQGPIGGRRHALP
jgi:hypothetical protein